MMISGVSFGISIGVLIFITILITITMSVFLVVLILSRKSLKKEVLKAKTTEYVQAIAVYEDLESVVKPPLPTIDTDKNAAYTSVSVTTTTEC